MAKETDIITPCIGVCLIDETTGWCMGCGRNRNEIASWRRFNDSERLRLIRKDLKERLKLLGRWPIASHKKSKDAD